MAAVLEELTISTEAMYPDLNMSVLSRSSAFARTLQERAVIDEEGSPIDVRVRYKRNIGGPYVAYQVLNVDPTEQFAKGSIQWRDLYVNVTASETDIVENAGMNIEDFMSMDSMGDFEPRSRKAIFNLFGKKMAGAIEDMQELLAGMFYGTDNTAIMPHGIETITSTSESYAGISVSELGPFAYTGIFSGLNDNIWQSRRLDASDAPIQLDMIGQGSDDASRGGADRVEMVFMPLDHYNNVELQLDGQKTRPNDSLNNIGFTNNIEWISKGLTFVGDDYCPANTVFGINFEHLKLYIHPALRFHFTGFSKPHNQRAIVGQLLVKLQMYCDDRAKLFRIDNVTA